MLNRLLQENRIEWLRHLKQHRLIEMVRGGYLLCKELVLDWGKRHRASNQALLSLNNWSRVHHVSQLSDGRILKNLFRRQPQPGLTGTRNHLDAQNGIAAQFEEVVMDTDAFQPKDIHPNASQYLFDGRAWSYKGVCEV